MKKNYSAILFDLDGTLTDSSPGILGCVRYALEKMNRKIPEETLLNGFLGPPLVYSFTEYCGMTPEEARQAAALYREVYKDQCVIGNSLYDGIYELLEKLDNAGKLLAVATTKPQVMADKITEHFGIKKFFAADSAFLFAVESGGIVLVVNDNKVGVVCSKNFLCFALVKLFAFNNIFHNNFLL